MRQGTSKPAHWLLDLWFLSSIDRRRVVCFAEVAIPFCRLGWLVVSRRWGRLWLFSRTWLYIRHRFFYMYVRLVDSVQGCCDFVNSNIDVLAELWSRWVLWLGGWSTRRYVLLVRIGVSSRADKSLFGWTCCISVDLKNSLSRSSVIL